MYNLLGELVKIYQGMAEHGGIADCKVVQNRKYIIGGDQTGNVLCWDLQTQALLMRKRVCQNGQFVNCVEWDEETGEVIVGGKSKLTKFNLNQALSE